MIQVDEHTQIQPVRYGKGSNLMGLLGTILVDEAGPARWLAAALRHPLVFARSLWLRRWSERTVILLVMQARDNTLRLRLKRGRLTSLDSNAPGTIPVANEGRAHRRRVDRRRRRQLDQRGWCWALRPPRTSSVAPAWTAWSTTTTASSRLPACTWLDGSAVNANLGVNPSLTIAAQAERACSLWPNAG